MLRLISGGINGAAGDIPTAILVSFMGGFYLEYRETKDAKRAVAAGVYDGISTFLVPSTYNIYVKKDQRKWLLSVFRFFFKHQYLDMEKVAFWMGFWKNKEAGK